MRLRHIQGAEETIASSPFVIQEPEHHRGTWNQVFGNSHPLEIEVGMGKGRFIMEKHPPAGYNYIGIELLFQRPSAGAPETQRNGP